MSLYNSHDRIGDDDSNDNNRKFSADSASDHPMAFYLSLAHDVSLQKQRSFEEMLRQLSGLVGKPSTRSSFPRNAYLPGVSKKAREVSIPSELSHTRSSFGPSRDILGSIPLRNLCAK